MLSLLYRTLDFSIPVLVTIFIGLFGAGLLLELGALSRISSLSRPLISVARLPEVSASSFVVSLGSTVTANGMIARFREEGLLEDREVFLCAVVNSIPAYIREIFTYQLPVVIPALGLAAGGLYSMIFMVTALVKILLVVLLGRIFLRERPSRGEGFGHPGRVSARRAVAAAFRGQIRLFARIALVYVLMTLLVFALQDRGAFEILSAVPLAGILPIPAESLVPLASYVASPILGISMLGPMIHSGSLSVMQAMVVLMLGSMLMLPIFALKSLVPNYTALFGPRLGLSVVAFSTGTSIAVRLAFLLAFLRLV
jgi:hypothetical protein